MRSIPCTSKDNEVYENGNMGDKLSVYLCNQPFSWHGINWGGEIVGVRNRDCRAFARQSDNPKTTHDPPY